MSKKRFSPPVVKPNSGKDELELQDNENGVAVKSINLPMAQRQKESSKNPERAKNEDYGLTDAQFEEIVQSVLQKSLQECMGKRAAAAKSTEGLDPGMQTLEVCLAAEDDLGKKPEWINSDGLQFRRKKQSKCVDKADEKPAADNGGCKQNRKGVPKKEVHGTAQDVPDQEEIQEEEKADRGSGSSWCMAWVQCSKPSCEKWRRLSSDVDPSGLPEDWSCSQNPDLQYNSCSVAEEVWSGSENDVVYAIYFPGSIVWAKQYGYPWWPGIVEADPDIEEYFLFSSQSKYHVTFFGDSVSRAWIPASMLKNFGVLVLEQDALAKLRNKAEKKNLSVALEMAKEAEQMGLQERIRRFGFHSRFKGRESSKDYKTLTDCNGTSKPCATTTQEARPWKKSTVASDKGQEQAGRDRLGKTVLHDLSVVKASANVKKSIVRKGGKRTKAATENGSPPSKMSQRERLSRKAAAVLKGPVETAEKHNSPKGFKESFSVPQCKNTKAKCRRFYPSNNPPDITSSSYSSQQGISSKPAASSWARRKLVPRKGAIRELKEAPALEEDGEVFSSQEKTVFAEKNISAGNFSLVLYEE